MASQEDSSIIVPPLVSSLRKMIQSAINIDEVVKFVIPQARLMFVENLLRQNQELLRVHTQEWRDSYSTKVISMVSRVQGSGTSIQQLLPGILDCLPNGDMKVADEGLDVIIADMKDLSDHSKSVNGFSRSFLNLVKDDQGRFKIVEMVLKEQLSGDQGQHKRLKNLEYTLVMDIGSARGGRLKELREKQDSVRKEISSLESDMDILKALLPKVADLETNASALVESIEVTIKNISSQVDSFSAIKTTLQSMDEDEVLKRLNSALEDWKIITPEAEKLEKDFANVVVLHLELEQLLLGPWL